MNYGEVIQKEINEKYSNSPHRKKLAEKCLEKANEWLEANNPISTNQDKKKIKKECASYIKKNVDTTEEEQIYGSVLLMIIMGAVVSWLIQRLLDEIFDKEQK